MLKHLLVAVAGTMLWAALAQAGTPTPLDISNGFNLDAWVGPKEYTFAHGSFSGSNAKLSHVFGSEGQNFALYLGDTGWGLKVLTCDTSSNDGLSGNSYKYCSGTTSSTLTGTQGTPENGLLTSGVDGRSYYIASVSGNVLLPGDWTEVASPTGSGNNTRYNAAILGRNGSLYNIASVTMSVTPGYYSDVNFVLAAGGQGPASLGAANMQIWACYADGTSGLLWNFGSSTTSFQGPSMVSTTTPSITGSYNLICTVTWPYSDTVGTNGSVDGSHGSAYLYELAAPCPTDSTRILTSLKVVDTLNGLGSDKSTYIRELGIFAATATAVPAPYTVTVTQRPGGAVTVSPSAARYIDQAQVTVTATASAGYVFAGWNVTGGTVTPSGSQATLTVQGNVALSASFAPAYTVTVNQRTGGTVAVSPSAALYLYNATATATATASAGYVFANWVVTGGTVAPSASQATLTVQGNVTLAASFTALNYSGTETMTGGTISLSSSGPYTYGQVITVTAAAQAGYFFSGWNVTGPSMLGHAAAPVTTLTVYDDFTLTAGFTLIASTSYTLTAGVSQPAAGTVTCTPSQATYHYGDQVSISASIIPGRLFVGWSATGGTLADPSSLSTTLTLTGNCALTANVVPLYSVAVSVPQGTATVTLSQAQYPYGSVVTIATSTVNTGKVLDHWDLTGAGVLSNSCALTTSLTVQGNVWLTAVYATGSYVNNLSPSASDSNPGSLARPLKTINKATSTAQAGTTIVVLQGVYRETVGLGSNGTALSPITLRSNPGDRVVINGANVIPSGGGSWTPCTAATAGGNPNYANMYYTDISWNPATVFQDEAALAWATTPTSTWWVVPQGTSLTLTDVAHLSHTDSNYYLGARVCMWYTGNTTQGFVPVTSYDPATSTITCSGGWALGASWTPSAGVDRYYIYNCLPVLNGPGQAVVSPSGSGYRVYVWPTGGGRPDGHRFEGTTTQNFLFGLGARSYWVISGLEICNVQGYGIGSWSGGSPGYITIQNCVTHHNTGDGIFLNGSFPNCKILNNYVRDNGSGIAICTSASNTLIQGNDVCWNGNDGVDLCSSSSSVIGNYLHDHWLWGHADNLQFYVSNGSSADLTNILVQDNLNVNAMQGTMIQQINGVAFRGNTYYCTTTYMFNFNTGYGPLYNFDWEHNTIMFSGYSPIALADLTNSFGVNSLHNNIFMGNGPGPYGMFSSQIPFLTSDYNLYYGTQTTSADGFATIDYNSCTFSQWRTTTSQEANGLLADPKFKNMAPLFLQGAFGKYQDFSPDHFYAVNGVSGIAVGDYLNIDFDGVPRQVTAINTASNFVTFTPSAAKYSFKYGTAFDWKSQTDFTVDLTLQPGSPALGAASDGTNLGSSVDVQSYMAGNFGVYGRRPAWPPAAANATRWAVTATHSGCGLAVSCSECQIEPRVCPTSLSINFDYALSAATITSAAVSIVNETGSSYSNRVASAALDGTGQVLTVTLSSPLPDGHWYTVALNSALTAANGGPVRGTKSIRIGMLAGNVTGSGRVTAADVAAVRGHVGQAVTAETALYDVCGNGVITAADQRQVQMLVGHSLP